jgi:hypothetical protein
VHEFRVVERAPRLEDDAKIAVDGCHAFLFAEFFVQRESMAVYFLRAFEIAPGLKGHCQMAACVCQNSLFRCFVVRLPGVPVGGVVVRCVMRPYLLQKVLDGIGPAIPDRCHSVDEGRAFLIVPQAFHCCVDCLRHLSVILPGEIVSTSGSLRFPGRLRFLRLRVFVCYLGI